MPRLHAAVKCAIVRGLASFDTPGVVAKAIKAEYGVAVTPQQVEAYDPTKRAGAALSAELREIFIAEREKAKTSIDDVAIAHKPMRLRKLQKAIERAEARGNDGMLLQLLGQAAREVGGMFESKRQVAVEAKVTSERAAATSGDVAAAIAEALRSLAEEEGGNEPQNACAGSDR